MYTEALPRTDWVVCEFGLFQYTFSFHSFLCKVNIYATGTLCDVSMLEVLHPCTLRPPGAMGTWATLALHNSPFALSHSRHLNHFVNPIVSAIAFDKHSFAAWAADAVVFIPEVRRFFVHRTAIWAFCSRVPAGETRLIRLCEYRARRWPGTRLAASSHLRLRRHATRLRERRPPRHVSFPRLAFGPGCGLRSADL